MYDERQRILDEVDSRMNKYRQDENRKRRINNVLGGVAPLAIAGGLLYMGKVRGSRRASNQFTNGYNSGFAGSGSGAGKSPKKPSGGGGYLGFSKDNLLKPSELPYINTPINLPKPPDDYVTASRNGVNYLSNGYII